VVELATMPSKNPADDRQEITAIDLASSEFWTGQINRALTSLDS
jgi:hypothetical protein